MKHGPYITAVKIKESFTVRQQLYHIPVLHHYPLGNSGSAGSINNIGQVMRSTGFHCFTKGKGFQLAPVMLMLELLLFTASHPLPLLAFIYFYQHIVPEPG